MAREERVLMKALKILKKRRDHFLHMLMAFVGGTTAGYALLVRGEFAQAQTANLAKLFLNLTAGSVHQEALECLVAAIVFAAGLTAAHLIKRWQPKERCEIVCILVEAVFIFLEGLVPDGTPVMPACWLIFTLTAYQWGTFAGVEGYNCSTIFSSNNFKQALFGWLDYAMDKDRAKLHRAAFYSLTLVMFYSAVSVQGLFAGFFGTRTVWLAFAPLAVSAVIWLLAGSIEEEKEEHFEEGPENFGVGTSEL